MFHPDVARRTILQAGAAGALGLLLPRPLGAAQPVPRPEPGELVLSYDDWLGYGLYEVARRRGSYAGHGLRDVSFVDAREDKLFTNALARGQIGAACVGTNEAVALAARGLPIRIVMLLDWSMAADAVIAVPEIASIAALKGREVAFRAGSVNSILLNAALVDHGLEMHDIVPVTVPTEEAARLVASGRCPAAAVHEPFLSVARRQNPRLNVLYTAAAHPGLISDVLIVGEETMRRRPGQVFALISVWDEAVAYYRRETAACREIMARAAGSNVEELATAFDGISYYSLADNRRELGGQFSAKTFDLVVRAVMAAGALPRRPAASELVDTSFVGRDD